MKIGFIGTGDITKAIVTGLDRARYPCDGIVVSRRNAETSARLARDCPRVRIESDNQRIVDEADMLFLAVRPQVAEEVLSVLRFRPGQLVVSLVAALTHERLRGWTGPDVTIIRAMPMPFVATCEGPTLVFPANKDVETLFSALGRPIVVPTLKDYDAIGVASTTMGLYFGIEEVVVDWLGAKGIGAEDARAYADAVFLNLAKTGTAQKSKSLAELRKNHSTRGGLNEQLFRVFVDTGGIDALKAGLDSVYARVRHASPSENRD